MQSFLIQLAAKATVSGLHRPHVFRHGFAKGTLEQGANLAQVSQLMGHSTSAIKVDFYGQFGTRELQDFHNRYSWIPDHI